MIIPLRTVIGNIPDYILESVSRFSCLDADVESFLKEKAFDFERRDKSRTYFVFDNGTRLLGYFTLSLKALPFKAAVSKNMVKTVDGFSKNVHAAGMILIGQLGKDSVLGKDLDGKELLESCLDKVYKAQEIVGGRFVMLECKATEKVLDFYRRNGFEFLQNDEKDVYLQMVRRL